MGNGVSKSNKDYINDNWNHLKCTPIGPFLQLIKVAPGNMKDTSEECKSNSFSSQLYWLTHYLNNVEYSYIQNGSPSNPNYSNTLLLSTLGIVSWANGTLPNVPPVPSDIPANFPIQSPSPATNIWISKSKFYTYIEYIDY